MRVHDYHNKNWSLNHILNGEVVHATKGHPGRGDMAPLILNFTTRLLWVVSLLSQLLYSREKSCPITTEQQAEWAPKQVWTLERREKSLPPAWIQTPDHPACSPVSIMTMVSHMLYCILNQFKTLHVPITQGLNSLVTIYAYSPFRNTETERTYVHLCVMNRETDGRKLPVITIGPSDRAQTPTQNISYIYTWCQKRAIIWNDAYFN